MNQLDEAAKNKSFRQVLTAGRTEIPGLLAFGWARENQPILPILPHSHRDKLEFILVTSGFQQMNTGGLELTVYGGQALFIGAGEEHFAAEKQQVVCETIWFQLDLSVTDRFLGLDNRDAGLLRRTLRAFSARCLEIPPSLAAQWKSAFALLSGENETERLEGRILFLSSLLALLRCRVVSQVLSSDIDRAKQYILLHVKDAIDIDELLLESGLAVGEFRKKFGEQLGCSVREYINRQKIESAKRMVAKTQRSMADIAYEYHFSSASFFKSTFKKITGMSPQKYRRLARKEKNT